METDNLPLKLVFISTNVPFMQAGKIREFFELFEDMITNNEITLDVLSIPIKEIQSDPDTIIKEKLQEASKDRNEFIIIEDTSLFFEAWGSLPGPYIKDFRSCLGVDGLLKMIQPFECKKARVECRVGLSCPEKGSQVFLGVMNGEIVSPRGKNDFLWDPIFKPSGYEATYAEMNKEEKNRISDRGIAVNLAKEYLRSIINDRKKINLAS